MRRDHRIGDLGIKFWGIWLLDLDVVECLCGERYDVLDAIEFGSVS